MFKYALAASFAAVSVAAFAQELPKDYRFPMSQPDVVLKQHDFEDIQRFVSTSKMHITMDDGTAHPLIDGAELMRFLNTKLDQARHDTATAEAAKRLEAEKKAKEAAPAPAPAPSATPEAAAPAPVVAPPYSAAPK